MSYYLREAKDNFYRSFYNLSRYVYYYTYDKWFSLKNKITGVNEKLARLEDYESSREIYSELVRRVEECAAIYTPSKLNAMRDMVKLLKAHEFYKIDNSKEFVEVMQARTIRLK